MGSGLRYTSKDDVIADSANINRITNLAGLQEMHYQTILTSESYTPNDSASSVWGGTAPTTQDDALDKLQAALEALTEDVGEEVVDVVLWDQSVDGDIATGAGVELDIVIPDEAVITYIAFDKLVAVTGGTGDIKAKVGSVDISAALATPGSTGTDDGNLSDPPKTTASGAIALYSATTAYTAGKINVIVKYVVSPVP